MSQRIEGVIIAIAFIVLVVVGVILGLFIADQWLARNIDTPSSEEIAEAPGVEETVEEVVEVVEEETVEVVAEPALEEVLRDKIILLDPPGRYAFFPRGTLGFNEVFSRALENPYFLNVLLEDLRIFSSFEELAYLSEDREFFQEIFFFENPQLEAKIRDATSSVQEVVDILHRGGYKDIDVLKKGTNILNYGWRNGELVVFRQTLQRDRFVLLHNEKPVILVSCGNPIKLWTPPEPEPKPTTPTLPSPTGPPTGPPIGPPTEPPPPPPPPPPPTCPPGEPGPEPNGGGCDPGGGPGPDPS